MAPPSRHRRRQSTATTAASPATTGSPKRSAATAAATASSPSTKPKATPTARRSPAAPASPKKAKRHSAVQRKGAAKNGGAADAAEEPHGAVTWAEVRDAQDTVQRRLWKGEGGKGQLNVEEAAGNTDVGDADDVGDASDASHAAERAAAAARLRAILRGCVVGGESNSVLIVGPRGSGKSHLVRTELAQLATEPEAAARGFQVVYVSGLVHADDAAAIRHVAHALAPEATAAAEAATASAASNASGAAESAPQASGLSSASAAETARALQAALRAGGREHSRCLVVVVDEFDLYAHQQQQAFLYALLDHVQSGAAPLAVVGLTCRLDTTALLEKRVLSRFSHQQIHLFRGWSLAAYVRAFGHMLRLPPRFAPKHLAHRWNDAVDEALENATLQRELRALYDISRANLRPLQQLAHLVAARTTPERPCPSAQDVFAVRLAQAQDTKVALLLSASALELCLVIALNNLAHRGRLTPNFEMVYEAYRSFANSLQRDNFDFYSRPVALKAFEHLCDMELVKPAEGRGTHMGDAHRPMRLMLADDQVLEVLDKCATLSTRVKLWGKHHGLLSA